MLMLKDVLKLAVAAIAIVAASNAAAQGYPNRPVKIVVPATTGGAIDVIARVLADKMTASLGQPVVVENKPGASNNLGTDFVAKLNASINAALKMDDVRAKLQGAGIEIQGGTPEQFAAVIRTEVDKWGRIVKAAGIQAD